VVPSRHQVGIRGQRGFYRGLRDRLIDYAEAQFELDEQQEDGSTLRQHLQRLAANTGRADERLFIECPAGCKAIWSVFAHLGRTRPRGMGASGIAFAEIEAWQRLTGVQLSPWELDALTEIDARVLAQAGKKGSKA
jgi:hypothetical protein